jgi:aminoglycoside phosphotransferase family enzyme/predicted kinase
VTATFPRLIEALRDPACYDHAVETIQALETHISWIVLTGPFAYKIKKPLNLGFLDFSTLAKRRFYCEEELRLNRRLAPEIYLEVVAVAGTPEAPRVNGPGVAFEYAVKMVQFPQDAQLDRVLARGELTPEHIDTLARELAAFHGRAAGAGEGSPYGTPAHVLAPMEENFRQIRARVAGEFFPPLDRLETWTVQRHAQLRTVLEARRRGGFVRECHGDAHLANMALREGRVLIFDCLEFNENLRWIDVMSELAFVVMDLDDRDRSDLARRCLNTYLEHTGDYAGLTVLRFYQTYRALVRAKVDAIRVRQPGLSPDEAARLSTRYREYTALAERYTQPAAPVLIVTHGLSGSGKTWFSQRLLESFDAIRVRSDVERKRLHGLAALAPSGSQIETGLYTPDASRRTYERLAELARLILGAGFPVIVDAAFLKRRQRDLLRSLATDRRVPFVILDMRAPEAVLRERVRLRAREARDASEAGLAVLDHQLATHEPLAPDELEKTLGVDSRTPPATAELVAELRRLPPA